MWLAAAWDTRVLARELVRDLLDWFEVGGLFFAGGFDVGEHVQNFFLAELVEQAFGHGGNF